MRKQKREAESNTGERKTDKEGGRERQSGTERERYT